MEQQRPHSTPRRLRANPLSSLRYRDNRVFWFGTTLSSIGQAAFLVSSSWFAFRLGGSGAVGLVTFATMVPLFLATLVGGLLADRADRRLLVLSTEAAQGIIALVIGVQAIRGALPLPELVLLVFASGIARAIEQPTVQTVLPGLVPRDELLNVFSLSNLATRGSRFAGPALVAALLATRGAGPAFLVIAALYLLAIGQVLRVHISRQVTLAPTSLVEQVKEGGRYIRDQGAIALLLGVIVLHCLLTMAFDSTLPLFASQSLRGDGAIYSSLISAMGLGSIVAALVLAGMRSRRQRGALLFVGGIGSGIATALMAVMMNNLLALASIFIVGAMTTFFMTLANTIDAGGGTGSPTRTHLGHLPDERERGNVVRQPGDGLSGRSYRGAAGARATGTALHCPASGDQRSPTSIASSLSGGDAASPYRCGGGGSLHRRRRDLTDVKTETCSYQAGRIEAMGRTAEPASSGAAPVLRDPLVRLNTATFLLSVTIYSPILVLFYTGRGLSLFQILSLEALNSAVITLFQIPTGAIADRIGLKRIVFAGHALQGIWLSS